MDERAELNVILLDDQPVDWKVIKPRFPSYEDMYIHIIENDKKMSKVARKESRLITKMIGRPPEELHRKLLKLRDKEMVREHTEEHETPPSEHKSRYRQSAEAAEDIINQMESGKIKMRNSTSPTVSAKTQTPKSDERDPSVEKSHHSRSNRSERDSEERSERKDSDKKESDKKESEKKESDEKMSDEKREHKDERREDHKKEEKKEEKKNKKKRHSWSLSSEDSDLDNLSSDDEFANKANKVRDNEMSKYSKVKNARKEIDKLQKIRDHYEYKFDRIREIYPDEELPPITDFSDPRAISRQYHRTVKKLKLKKSLESYNGYMFLGFTAIELVGSRFLNVDMSGYAEEQMSQMSQYNKLLVEIGERKYASVGGNLPVEVRLMGLMFFNALIFFITRKFGISKNSVDNDAFDMNTDPVVQSDFGTKLPTPAPKTNPNKGKWRAPSWGNKR